MPKYLTYEEWKKENPLKISPGFNENCIAIGLDPEVEIENILHSYYESYLMIIGSENDE